MNFNLLRHVYAQLPRDIKDEFKIDVKADAFLIRATATFVDAKGRSWETSLETEDSPPDADGRVFVMATKVPEVFLAQLCTVV